MQLKESALDILTQLKSAVIQLKANEYNASLDLLSGNSIGKHIRHILEFFDLLLNAHDQETINYDCRKHDLQLENEKDFCIEKIEELIKHLQKANNDRPINLEVSYSTHDANPESVHTSFNRELAYNIEHSIHHMAIIKIALITLFPHVEIPVDFGVAYSTVRYQKNIN